MKPAAAWVIAALGLASAVSIGGAGAGVHKPIRWLLNGPGAAAIAADAQASTLLDDARPFVMLGPRVPTIPPRWNAVPFASFTSFSAIRDTLGRNGIDPGAKGVMYDYEKWRFTPEPEQRDPAVYVKRAAELVHARGLLFLTAPAVNLVVAMAPEGDGKRYDAYLRLGIAADAARYADVFDIQAQGSERNTAVYADFVRRAAAQARAANPAIVVLAGISTQPNGQQVTAEDILRAIAATRDSVDGYWFNIPLPSEHCPGCTDFRPDIAIAVLQSLAAQ